MSQLNKLKFEEYSKFEYLCNQEDAEDYFRTMKKFPFAVGFDRKSNGYLVINKKHSPSGLENEVPGSLILKKLGYCVVLLEETSHKTSVDIEVDGVNFEMKRFINGKDLLDCVERYFRETYRKTDKLLLHIDKKVDVVSIKRSLRLASKKYGSIKTVFLIFENSTIQLNKEMMKSGKYWLEKK
jgi:hypothetical protein